MNPSNSSKKWLDLWWKTDCHRTVLACVQGATTLAGASVGDASTCTCYRRLCWRCFRSRVTFLLDNLTLSFFLHVSGSYCTMCQVPVFSLISFYWHTFCAAISPRVNSTLDHVSYFYWSTWPFLIWPHIMVLSVHVFLIWPCGLMTSFHVSDF
jgi:hypothetical protein